MLAVSTGRAQDIFKRKDLSGIDVSKLSDEDIAKFRQQLKASGMSYEQAEQAALLKGLPQTEAARLRERLAEPGAASDTKENTGASIPAVVARETAESAYKEVPQKPKSDVFGASFFTTQSLSFEPNLRIATPSNYLLGADDQLIITVSGYQEMTFSLQVMPEGNITIPQVGSVVVSGMTIEAATARIRSRMSQTAYPTLKSGQSKVSVTLGRIRSIRITVIGAAKPGNYTVSSLSTVFNSLYQSGGPGDINTYREIELRRNNQVYRKIDLYQFLTKGDESGNVVLKEGDVINFPVYKTRVKLTGEVKRPGIFELKAGETVQDLLFYAGGFTDKAYKAGIKAKQLTDIERRIKDISKAEYDVYQPADGDEFQVDAVLDRYENAVSIKGAVYRPGQFELTPGLTAGELIRKAGGLQEDVFMDRAIITRVRADKTKETLTFSVSDVLKGGAADIVLMKRDEIAIASATNFISRYTVTIEGEVRRPGVFPYADNLSLRDLLFQSGSFTDAASSYRIEVGRRLVARNAVNVGDSTAKVYELNTDRGLGLENDRFILKPFDIVTVRKNPGYIEQKRVSISGEVNFPGTFTLERRDERVSDLLKRAGGLTPSAYTEGVFLIRSVPDSVNLEAAENALAVQSSIRDSSSKVVNDIKKSTLKIAIDARAVLEHPGTSKDYVLLEGDEIQVIRMDPLVKISGEVLHATKTSFENGKSVRHYLSEAGGATDNARKSKIYVLYPNGEVDQTHSALFGLIRSYPPVRTGSEIIVPRKTDRKPLSVGEMVSVSSGLVSLVSLLVITINSLAK
jgi:protein involved in polysaccharide export with SLBB domain